MIMNKIIELFIYEYSFYEFERLRIFDKAQTKNIKLLNKHIYVNYFQKLLRKYCLAMCVFISVLFPKVRK